MRLLHVDIARGLCILLVALGHNPTLSPDGSHFNQILGTFRMPLMFFIAGTFFVSQTPFRALLTQKADALLKPFLVMALLQAPFRLAFWDADPLTYSLGVLSGSGNYLPWLYALWFLPHLWLLFLFSWGIARLSRHWDLKTPEMLMLMGTLLMLGVQTLPVFWLRPVEVNGLHVVLKGLPFSADLLPISSFFFLLGMLVKRSFHEMQFRWPALLLSIAILSWTIVLYLPRVSLFERGYTHLFAGTVAALAGSAIVIELAAALVKVPRLAKWLAYCGTNSLFILMFHSPIQNSIIKLLDKGRGYDSMLSATIAYAACIAASLAAAHVSRKHLWLGVLFLPLKQLRKDRAGHAQPAHASMSAEDAHDIPMGHPHLTQRIARRA